MAREEKGGCGCVGWRDCVGVKGVLSIKPTTFPYHPQSKPKPINFSHSTFHFSGSAQQSFSAGKKALLSSISVAMVVSTLV